MVEAVAPPAQSSVAQMVLVGGSLPNVDDYWEWLPLALLLLVSAVAAVAAVPPAPGRGYPMSVPAVLVPGPVPLVLPQRLWTPVRRSAMGVLLPGPVPVPPARLQPLQQHFGSLAEIGAFVQKYHITHFEVLALM